MLFFAVYYLIIMLGCLLPVLIVERVAGVPGAPDSNAMSGTATHLTKNSGIDQRVREAWWGTTSPLLCRYLGSYLAMHL